MWVGEAPCFGESGGFLTESRCLGSSSDDVQVLLKAVEASSSASIKARVCNDPCHSWIMRRMQCQVADTEPPQQMH